MAGYTESDLALIREKIASGVKSVTFADGRKAEYHSLTEMMAAERVIKAQLAMAAGMRRKRLASYRSGL